MGRPPSRSELCCLTGTGRGSLVLMSRTGEKILGVIAIAVGVGLAILTGIEADIPPVVLVLLTVIVIGWVISYFAFVRPSVTGVKRRSRTFDREPE
jgi:hypothetical protein